MGTTFAEDQIPNDAFGVFESGQLSEGISAGSFINGLVAAMQKHLPKDRWTVTSDHGDIIVKNDFDETASFRIDTFESNEGKFRQPNIPIRGSADENKTFEGTFVGKSKYIAVTSVPTGSIELFRFTEIPQHLHKDQNHFLYILKGRASGNIGDVKGEVGPGTLVVIPAGVQHGFNSVGNESVDFILFSSPKFNANDTMQIK